MLRYDRQTKPGLVALYDIRPGNGAGPFLQPRSPHGAIHPCHDDWRLLVTSSLMPVPNTQSYTDKQKEIILLLVFINWTIFHRLL